MRNVWAVIFGIAMFILIIIVFFFPLLLLVYFFLFRGLFD